MLETNCNYEYIKDCYFRQTQELDSEDFGEPEHGEWQREICVAHISVSEFSAVSKSISSMICAAPGNPSGPFGVSPSWRE